MTTFLTLLHNTEATRCFKPGVTLLREVAVIKKKKHQTFFPQTTYLQREKKKKKIEEPKICTIMESSAHFRIF